MQKRQAVMSPATASLQLPWAGARGAEAIRGPLLNIKLMENNLPKPLCPHRGAWPVPWVVLEPAQRLCQHQRTLAGATDTVRGQNPRVPAAQPVLSHGNVPIYLPEAGRAAEPDGRWLPVTALEISSAPPRL